MPSDLHVVFVQPEIHWNTGNMGRTCLAVGAQLHLVKPLGFSLEEKAVRRAGLDYWHRVNPRVWEDWECFAQALPALGTAFFFTGQGATDLWSVAFPKPSVLIFGSESVGLPPVVRQTYWTQTVGIPMQSDSIRSLNLSTCGALAAYEVRRQWGGVPTKVVT